MRQGLQRSQCTILKAHRDTGLFYESEDTVSQPVKSLATFKTKLKPKVGIR